MEEDVLQLRNEAKYYQEWFIDAKKNMSERDKKKYGRYKEAYIILKKQKELETQIEELKISLRAMSKTIEVYEIVIDEMAKELAPTYKGENVVEIFRKRCE